MADWPHAPVHRLGEKGTFIVTAGTYKKEHFFAGEKRLRLLHDTLLLLTTLDLLDLDPDHPIEDLGWASEE